MTEIIKKLRQETGAGMMECKKALDQAEGDANKAKTYLMQTMEKKIGNERVASKGQCGIRIHGNQAILFEVNAETDFVSKHAHFIKLMQSIGDGLIDTDVLSAKDALHVTIGESTVSDMIRQASGIIQEHVTLRRFYRVEKHEDHTFGHYVHMQGKVIALVILDRKQESLARDLAMQVAANSPVYLSLESVDPMTLDYERFLYEKEHGTFEEVAFLKGLAEKSLYDQTFIKDPKKRVSEHLKEAKANVVDFFRFELGQGIDNKLNCRLDIPCDGSKITVTPIF